VPSDGTKLGAVAQEYESHDYPIVSSLIKGLRDFSLRPSFIAGGSHMGMHRVVLPEAKFSGQEELREFLRDFEVYVTVNEWTDEKAGHYLAVYSKDEAKAFYHQ